ncbi:phage tail length tape measure family protein [Rhizobium sp. ZK1]|uniref:phage tail length tape measure family protein n=1 Tax=Rhizobium sp. ZK1 TaxID=3389872 RepID=UPI0039F6BA96
MANVEVRTLRVSAEMDASKYTAGAQEVSNANDRLRQAGKGLGDSFTENEQKISNSGNVLSKLSRQYIDGYANAQRFNQAINQLTRGVETGKIQMTEASAILDGVYRKYGLMADAARIAERGQTDLAKAVQLANARLEQQTKVNVSGAANDNEAQYRRQNLGFQLQDIGVSLYGGMPVTTVLAQQGSQIVGLYSGAGGVNAALRDFQAILAGLVRYVAPFAAAGVVAYGAYKIFAANTVEAKLAVDDMTKALAAQAQPMSAVESQLTELQKLQSEYAKALNTTARTHDVASAAIVAGTQKEYEAKRALLELELKRQEAARAVAQSELEITGLRLKSAIAQQVTTNMDLERQGFSDPRIGRFVQVPDSVTGLEKTRDVLANNELTDKVKELRANLSLTDIALQKLREGLGLVGPSASGQVSGINELTKALKELQEVGKAALSPADEAARRAMAAIPVVNGILDEESRRRVLAAQRAAQQRLDNQNPTITNGDGVRVGVPVPTQRPNVELEGLPGDAKTQKSSAEAYRDLVKSANDRIEQMQLEAKVAGETGIAAEKMRLQLDLLQQAQDKGRTVTAAQRAEIEKLAEAYGRAATEAAKVRLNADLRFEREQLFRSSGDQEIASRLRGSGLPVDLNSQEAQIMRDNMRIEELRAGVKGFFTDFRDGLTQGDSFGKALGDAVINALTNAVNKMSERWIDQLVNSLLGGVSGGGLLSKIGVGSLAANDNFTANTTLSKLLGANDNIGRAPVTPVTSAPLGDVASFISARAPLYGVDPNIALKVARSEGGLSSWNLQSGYVKNGIQEQSFGPFQLYKGGGLGNLFMRQTGLDPALAANGPAATDWSLRYASQNGWGSWYGAAKAGVGNWDGIGGRGTNAAVEAVNKLGTSADLATKGVTSLGGGLGNLTPAVGSAAQGLNQFGSGVGTFGQKLANAFPAAPSSGGGGLFSKLFGGLFGGGLNAFGTSVLGSSAQFAGAWAGGGIGLYASGTDYAPGGLAVVGEGGRELVNLPRGSQVIPNHRTEAMLSGVGGGSPTTVIFKPNIINNNGSNVRTERRDTNDGPQFDIIIDEAVANNMSTPGSRSRRAVKSQFGLSESLARR